MTKSIEPRLETKVAALPAGDVNALFADFMNAFEEFKSTNDQRLGELEKRGSADTLLEGKLDRLNAVLDGHKSALDKAAVDKARPSSSPTARPPRRRASQLSLLRSCARGSPPSA